MAAVEEKKLTIKDFASKGLALTSWCPGCGDYGILAACKSALMESGVRPHQALFVGGIGCGSKLPDYIRTNGINTLHGRPVPVAQGFKLGNHKMNVFITDGDGDCYGIGGNHWIHIMRRNPDLVHIVEDNQVYGLTKGQYAPTSELGFVGSTSPDGSIETPINPVVWAINCGATFVARAFSGDVKHLVSIIKAGMEHNGYAFIDVLQPCVIYDPLRANKTDWYRERCYKLEDDVSYDVHDRMEAYKRAHEWGDGIPIGILYLDEERPSHESHFKALQSDTPLMAQPLRHLPIETYEALRKEYI